ncbi:ribosome hibernation-promoting factor, HPF/YfiA family [Flocculibacter collagenilyticus]|uniref:ribosome hibernation-promoting factor, HPF/YfiA family n=1 Tax=Flocculibacter collagenilyticus TaxID=2744479 RepID=UPI0018F5E9E0|nr:ribosome-associated translation inhibitor RaiA [Flocculibacter collagenilyticus]
MQITISGHHVEITDAIQDVVEKKLQKISNHYPSLLAIEATLTVEKKNQTIELHTNYEGAPISVTATDMEMYKAIASSVKKLESALSHRKGVLNSDLHTRRVDAQVEVAAPDNDDADLAEESMMHHEEGMDYESQRAS